MATEGDIAASIVYCKQVYPNTTPRHIRVEPALLAVYSSASRMIESSGTMQSDLEIGEHNEACHSKTSRKSLQC